VYKPLIVLDTLDSVRLLTYAMRSFKQHCVSGILVNEARVTQLLQSSLMLVTALAPHIGYDRAAQIAKHAHQHNLTLREAALSLGCVSAEQFDAWVDKYFAPIQKPNLPLPRVNVKEAERTGEKRFTEYGANVPLPGVGITYLIPAEKSEDAPALTMADIILSRGRSSRLYQSLIYQQQVAQTANSNADLREDLGVFQLTAIVAAGKKPEDAEAALLAEIKKLRDAPVTPTELEKAKNQIITSQLRQRETNNGKANALGQAAVLLGDPNRVNTDLDKLQAVTAADVQRVARKYFTDKNRYVFIYLPESSRPASGAKATSQNGERGSSPTVRAGSTGFKGAYAK
jgi:zinc protease